MISAVSFTLLIIGFIIFLEELSNVVQRSAFRAVRLPCPIAQRDDRHYRLVLRNLEELTECIGIAHSHDECIETHGTCLQNQVAVAQAIVIGTPSVTDFIRLVTLEEARLASLER